MNITRSWPTGFFAAVVFVVGAVGLAACSDSSGASASNPREGSDTSGTEPAAADCGSRCAAKITGCGATPAQAGEMCRGVCGNAPTESQMTCLEAASCASGTDTAGRECGIGASPSPSPSSPSPSAPSPSPPKTECVDAQGNKSTTNERYVCTCSNGIEVYACAPNLQQACTYLCDGRCKASCRAE